MEGYKETAAIHILTEYSEKLIWEQSLRSLWQTCFHDPQHYEDFYFDKVYANNKVYAIKDMGMVHVNFYRCKVLGHDMTLPYIVGVATAISMGGPGTVFWMVILWKPFAQK